MEQARKLESHLREQSRETDLVSNDSSSGAVEDWSKTAKSVMQQLTHLLRDNRPTRYSTARNELEAVRQSFQTNTENENLADDSDHPSVGPERGTDEAQGGHKAQAPGSDHDDAAKGDDDNDDGSCSSASSEDSDSTCSDGTTSTSSSDSDSSLSSGESNDAS